MNLATSWLAALVTVAVVLSYELSLAVAQRRRPERMARTVHANLREDWFEAVSAQKGSEVLAVQTLRNALMSASVTASTGALGLMGTVTLAVPSLHAEFGGGFASWSSLLPTVHIRRVHAGVHQTDHWQAGNRSFTSRTIGPPNCIIPPATPCAAPPRYTIRRPVRASQVAFDLEAVRGVM